MAGTREALIDAAASLLDEGGPAAVTLREVARLAGVSHNAPYKHFADKEDLLAAVVARDLTRQAEQLRRRVRGLPAIDAVRASLHGQIRHALRRPHLFRVTYGPWTTRSPELTHAATAGRAAFVELVAAAQREGALPAGDPERLASLLQSVVHGAVHLALAGHLARQGKGRADPIDLVDELLANLRTDTR